LATPVSLSIFSDTVFKALLSLCQAAILIGMSGLAPYLAGHCARIGMGDAMASMPGMWHGHSDIGGQSDRGARALESAGVLGREAGAPVHGPRHAPASAPHRHGCCGCLGPCATGGFAGLPSSACVAVAGPQRVAALPTWAPARALHAATRLLPFANGPPNHLG
jgi:hypothetical protein